MFQCFHLSMLFWSSNVPTSIYACTNFFIFIWIVMAQAHPWLLESEKEQLCQIISCQKLSLNACTHAAENERLPLRTVIRVLFFQQLNLRTAMERSLHLEGSDNIMTNADASLPTHDTQVDPGWCIYRRELLYIVSEVESPLLCCQKLLCMISTGPQDLPSNVCDLC